VVSSILTFLSLWLVVRISAGSTLQQALFFIFSPGFIIANFVDSHVLPYQSGLRLRFLLISLVLNWSYYFLGLLALSVWAEKRRWKGS